MVVLGIETTCDETAASLVRRHEDGRGEILSNVVLSQNDAHAPYGGVVPEIAARAHVEALDMVIARAMVDAAKGFGAHSDQERILEAELHRFVRFSYEVVYDLARRN